MLQQIRISAPSMCLTGNQISANQLEQIQCLKRVTWDFFFNQGAQRWYLKLTSGAGSGMWRTMFELMPFIQNSQKEERHLPPVYSVPGMTTRVYIHRLIVKKIA